MNAVVLAAAVPDLRSFEQLPAVRGVDRYAVLAPDGRTVLVSIDSPHAISRFRQLMAVPAIGAGVLELLAAGTVDEHGFVVQPMPVPIETVAEPAELARLLVPVAGALTALHAAGYCLGGLSASILALDPSGAAGSAGGASSGALIADLLPAIPLHSRLRPAQLSRLAGGLPSPPELGDGLALTAATDLFGLAALILTMLTGSGRWIGNPAGALRTLPVDATRLANALAIDPAAREVSVPELLAALGTGRATGSDPTGGKPPTASGAAGTATEPPPAAPPAAVPPTAVPPTAAPLTTAPRAANLIPPSPELARHPSPPTNPAASAPAAPAIRSGNGLPKPPPVRSRQAVRSADRPPASPVAVPGDGRVLPYWQTEIQHASRAIWGPVDPAAATLERPDLRFRPVADLGPLAETANRPIWRSPVVIGSVAATAIVLILALVLMLG